MINRKIDNKAVSSERNRPGTPDPIGILMREHAEALGRLSEITRAAESIKTEGFSVEAFAKITGTVRYIGREVRRHTELEERVIFPLIDRHVFESPNIIRHERREMWHSFNELVRAVNDVEDGFVRGTTIRELVDLSHRVVSIFTAQIVKENTTIFPMVMRVLTPDELKKLRADLLIAMKSD